MGKSEAASAIGDAGEPWSAPPPRGQASIRRLLTK